jgi:hypothetical protein
MICVVPDCEKISCAREFCAMHYARVRRNGHYAIKRCRANRESGQRNEMGLKLCNRCELWLSESNFHSDVKRVDKLSLHCKNCERNRRRAAKYNVDVDEMLFLQFFQCAICADPIDSASSNVDHDHSCCKGKSSCGSCVRGLLCSKCNVGIGSFRDNALFLRGAALYIERWSNKCK